MEIRDYAATVERLEEKIFTDEKVSETNKKYLRRFLLSYLVSNARKSIFLNRVHHFLQTVDDVLSVDRDTVNEWFCGQKKRYAQATLATSAKSICQFTEWLSDGKLLDAYKDLKKTPGARARRKLTPKNMIQWGDVMEMVKLSSSVQLQAIATVQLDGGFRPTEFISLRYGDIEVMDEFCVAQVRNGKTGSRHVVLFRSTAYLRAWLDSHPSKDPDDPLWINEITLLRTQQVVAYEYFSMTKRLRNLGRSARIDKPLDFYNFRHSSCSLDKKDNLPPDLAAERHGHSVKYYIEVYGRLDVKETVNRFRTHFGIPSTATQPVPIIQNLKTYSPKPNESQIEITAKQIAVEAHLTRLQKELVSLREQQSMVDGLKVS